MEWSDEQKAIFEWFKRGSGNLIVRARAGTGKTTTIVAAVKLAPEKKVLIAAFNKTIERELSKKVSWPIRTKTLHGLGFEFIKKNYGGKVSVDTDGDREWQLAKDALPSGVNRKIIRFVASLHTKVRECNPWAASIKDVESVAMRFGMLADNDLKLLGFDDTAMHAAALRAVEAAAHWTGAIDFADMIFLPCRHALCRPIYKLVVIDEAQDMTEAQLHIAQEACSGRIAIVGDDRQAIYGFRGADSGSIDRLKLELEAKELSLTTTYRCPKKVVRLANTIVNDYFAAPDAPEGIQLSVGPEKMMKMVKPGHLILSRTNAPMAKVCMALIAKGVPAKIRGRDVGRNIMKLIDKMGVKDLTNILKRLVLWKAAEHKKVKRKLDAEKIREKKAGELVEFIDDQVELIFNLADNCENYQELRDKCFTLFSDKEGAESVILSSVHKAKGTEAPVVWIFDNTLRYPKRDEPPDTEEENIRYVAYTRAMQELYLVDYPEKEEKDSVNQNDGPYLKDENDRDSAEQYS